MTVHDDCRTSLFRYFRVDNRDRAYLQFIVEAYDGLAVVSTVDAKEGLVRIGFPACLEDDVADLLRELAREIQLAPVPPSTTAPIATETHPHA